MCLGGALLLETKTAVKKSVSKMFKSPHRTVGIRPLLFAIVLVSAQTLSAQTFPRNIQEVKASGFDDSRSFQAQASQFRSSYSSSSRATKSIGDTVGNAFSDIAKFGGGQVHSSTNIEGCTSESGCAGLTSEDGQITNRYGDQSILKTVPSGSSTGGTRFKFSSRGGTIENAELPSDGPFWWMSAESPFRNAYQAYLKFKNTGVAEPPSVCTSNGCTFSGPIASATAPSVHIEGKPADIKNYPYINGQFEALAESYLKGQANDASSGQFKIDLSQNPFLNGQISGAGSNFEQSYAYRGEGASSSNTASGSSSSESGGSVYSIGGGESGSEIATTGVSGSGVLVTGSAVEQSSSSSSSSSGSEEGDDQGQGQEQDQVGVDFQQQFEDQQSIEQKEDNYNTGELTVSCTGRNRICVSKNQCINGVVSAGRVRSSGSKKCKSLTEVCCKLANSNSNGIGATFSNGNSNGIGATFSNSNSNGIGATFSNGNSNGIGATFSNGNPNGIGATFPNGNSNGIGATFSNGNSNGIGATFSNGFEATFSNSGSNKAGSASSTSFEIAQVEDDDQAVQPFPDIAPPSQGSSINSLDVNYQTKNTYRPGSEGGLKPGIPYLPPVTEGSLLLDETRTTKPPVPTTPKYIPVKTRPPRPPKVTTVPPYIPPRSTYPPYIPPKSTYAPYIPPQQVTRLPYIPPSTTYAPVTQKPVTYTPKPVTYKPYTKAPPYLPPYQSTTRDDYKTGSLLLDEVRTTPGVHPTAAYAGCAAALICTPEEFCTIEGVISKTPVYMTEQERLFRVPVTDCRIAESGQNGKCCRDPDYTDPWPTNQLGQWVPGAFGDDGSYKPNGEVKSKPRPRPIVPTPRPIVPTPRPIVPTPPIIGSSKIDVFRPRPTPIPSPRPPTVIGSGSDNYQVGQLLLSEFSDGQFGYAYGQCGLRRPGIPKGNPDKLEVDFGEIPWQAMILLKTNKSLLCGGVITRPEVVITTASCVEGLRAGEVQVKGGEWKLGVEDEPLPFQIVTVKRIIPHPGYRSGELGNDVAILVLQEAFQLTSNVYPICLPSETESIEELYQGTSNCVTTGWGKKVLQTHIPNALPHAIGVDLLNEGECRQKLQSYPALLGSYDRKSCVCGQTKNAYDNICKVDTGSALACDNGNGHWVLRGVFSWDTGCDINDQFAGFYKFDVEWYWHALGLRVSTKYTLTQIKPSLFEGGSGFIQGGLNTIQANQGSLSVTGQGSSNVKGGRRPIITAGGQGQVYQRPVIYTPRPDIVDQGVSIATPRPNIIYTQRPIVVPQEQGYIVQRPIIQGQGQGQAIYTQKPTIIEQGTGYLQGQGLIKVPGIATEQGTIITQTGNRGQGSGIFQSNLNVPNYVPIPTITSIAPQVTQVTRVPVSPTPGYVITRPAVSTAFIKGQGQVIQGGGQVLKGGGQFLQGGGQILQGGGQVLQGGGQVIQGGGQVLQGQGLGLGQTQIIQGQGLSGGVGYVSRQPPIFSTGSTLVQTGQNAGSLQGEYEYKETFGPVIGGGGGYRYEQKQIPSELEYHYESKKIIPGVTKVIQGPGLQYQYNTQQVVPQGITGASNVEYQYKVDRTVVPQQIGGGSYKVSYESDLSQPKPQIKVQYQANEFGKPPSSGSYTIDASGSGKLPSIIPFGLKDAFAINQQAQASDVDCECLDDFQ